MNSKPKCYNCGQPGHIARLCNYNRDEDTRTFFTYYYHGGVAHEYNKKLPQSVQCFRCQGFGHIARNCTVLIDQSRYKNAKKSTENHQSLSRSTTANQNVRMVPRTVTAANRGVRTDRKKVTTTNQNVWIDQRTVPKSKKNANSIGLRVKKPYGRVNLEILANEILLDIFEYLSIADLLCAFHDLNSRFQALLFTGFPSCHLDLQLISKPDLVKVCRQYLPLISNQIISVRLSDKDFKFKQTDRLPFFGLKLHRLNNLRSLSLCYVQSEQVMEVMMIECTHFPNLTHLKLIRCNSSFRHANTTSLSNTVWCLPKLTHYWVDTEQYVFYMPKKISSSLEYVSIQGHRCRLSELTELFEKTPHLRSLCVQHRDLNDNQYLSSSIPSMITLKLYDIHSRSVMMNILQNMTNLSYFSIETFYINLDGHQWKQIIIHHLPKLRVFRLKMDIQLAGKMNNEQQVDTLLDSFRSSFWLEKHKWFVRCHRQSQKDHSDILLYTIPLHFRNCNTNVIRSSYKSTEQPMNSST